MDLLKRLAAHLPADWQWNMRRRRYARQIRNNTFRTLEPEYDRLANWLHPGDWVIDIGANIGHYTKRMSELARLSTFEGKTGVLPKILLIGLHYIGVWEAETCADEMRGGGCGGRVRPS